jgi:hypothetical protein
MPIKKFLFLFYENLIVKKFDYFASKPEMSDFIFYVPQRFGTTLRKRITNIRGVQRSQPERLWQALRQGNLFFPNLQRLTRASGKKGAPRATAAQKKSTTRAA